MQPLQRVAAIHDLSGFGKCSLTVALPILSAAGIETVSLPTAILSTHTGGFEGYTFRDLTEDMAPIANHWKSLGIEFAALYTCLLYTSSRLLQFVSLQKFTTFLLLFAISFTQYPYDNTCQ